MSDVSRHAADLLARILAASVGGYALAYAFTGALALLLPVPRPDAVYISAMLAFLLYVTVILWAFAARSVLRVWLVLLAATASCALVLLLGWPAR